MLGNLGTHIMQFPTGKWGYVGSIPLELGELILADTAGILGCRVVGHDSEGKPLMFKSPLFTTEEQAREHAKNKGVILSN